MAGYTPNANSVVHSVKASLDRRGVPDIVHLVQYDKTMPVIAVELVKGEQPYKVPTGAEANVRMLKPDGTHVYNPVLGISEDRYTIYVGVTAQMTAADGVAISIVEITLSGGVVGSAPVTLDIDTNPVPEDSFESFDEYLTIQDLLAQAEAAAAAAKSSQNAAKTSEDNAKTSENAAKASQTAAKTSENNAKSSADAAKASQTAAATSATQAAASQTAAASSASAASASQNASKNSENAAKSSQTAAANSATAADASATESEEWAKKSQGWAEGGTNTHENEETNNSKYWSTQSKNSATASAASQTAAKASETNAKSSADAAQASQEAAAQSAETAKQYSGNPPEIDEDGFWETWDADAQKYTSTGEKAVNHWDKTYKTVEEMQADGSQPKNTVCIISSDVEQEENARVYMWDGAKWNFLCDLSGLQGVGIAKIELTGGDHIPGTDDTYTITLTDRRTYTFKVHNGSESVTSVNGETGAVTVKKIVSSVGGTYAGSQVTLNGDQKNEYLKIEAIKGSDLMDRVDIAVDKTDGHPWLHLWKGTSQASGDIGNQTVYTSAFPQPSVTGNAGTATKLSTPRSLKTNLGSTTVVTFDGSAAQDNIPVTGTLPIGNGGTGKTTAPEALTALGGVPTTRTVNGKALSTNITLSAADVNAVPVTGGTFTGSVYVNSTGESDVGVAFSGGMLYLFGMKSSAKRGLYDNKKNKFVIEIDDNITAHFLGTADQLGGHPASHFLRTDVTAPPSDDTPQNWQSIGACILYVPPAQAVSIGLPSTYGILMSMIPVVHQSDFVQVFVEMFNEGRMWTRCGSGGKWARNWTQV